MTDDLKVKAHKAVDSARVAAHSAYDDASVATHNALEGKTHAKKASDTLVHEASDDAKIRVSKDGADSKILKHEIRSEMKKR
jgi:hypothetical protein